VCILPPPPGLAAHFMGDLLSERSYDVGSVIFLCHSPFLLFPHPAPESGL